MIRPTTTSNVSSPVIRTNAPGPGSYDIPQPGWKRGVRGSVKMRPRRGPTERELTLSDGTAIRNILPAPESFTKPPPRTVSPTLLRVVSRQKSRGRSPPSPLNSSNNNNRGRSPTRECVIGLFQREWAARAEVGPGSYDLNAPVSPSRSGAYSRGIVFSSTPRGLGAIPRPSPVQSSPQQQQKKDDFADCDAADDDDDEFLNSSSARNRAKNRSFALRSVSPNRAAATQQEQSPSLLSPRHQRKQTANNNSSSGNKNNSKNNSGTFGQSPRLLDTSSINPFLPRIEMAPPPGTYGTNNAVARGGNRTRSAPKLHSVARTIDLARRTDAPGPSTYEFASSTDISKPLW